MSECDVLVCGQCHSVFHFMELFAEHKTQPCNKDSSLKDSVSIYILEIALQSSIMYSVLFLVARDKAQSVGFYAVEIIAAARRRVSKCKFLEAVPNMGEIGGSNSGNMGCGWSYNSIIR